MFPGEGSGDGSNITPFGKLSAKFGKGKAGTVPSGVPAFDKAVGDPPSVKCEGRAGVAGGAWSIGDMTAEWLRGPGDGTADDPTGLFAGLCRSAL
jgi:hypothetical protein